MSELVDRITAVLVEHPRYIGACKCRGWQWKEGDPPNGHAAHVAERIASELPELTPFWAIADGEGGISEECFDQLDRAEELLADWLDAGYKKAHLVTASFTGWSAWSEVTP